MNTHEIHKYILISIYFAITIIIILRYIHIIVPFPIILFFGLLLIIFWIPLVWNQGRNKEGKYFDYWSIIHGISGILLGLFSIPFLWSFLLIVLWEFTEIKSFIYEEYTNRMVDIILGLSGWSVTTFLVNGILST